MPRSACTAFAAIAAVALTACDGAPASPTTPTAPRPAVVANESLPLDGITVSTACGAVPGEPVLLAGTVHVVTTETVSASGTVQRASLVNYQGVTGTGLLSGATYTATEAGPQVTTARPGDPSGGGETTIIATVQMIARGRPGSDFHATLVFHQTVNANGEPTSTVEEVRVACRG